MSPRIGEPAAELIGQIYEAIVSPKLWPAFLENLADRMKGASAVLYFRDLERLEVRTAYSCGLQQEFLTRRNERFLSLDPWGSYLALQPAGQVFATHGITPDRTLERSEFYSDYLRPFSIFYAAGGFFVRHGNLAGQIGVQRCRRQGGFDPSELQLLARLMPHLRRAFALSRRLGTAESTGSVLARLLDDTVGAVILLGVDGRVLMCSDAAERLLDGDGGLSVRDGRLIAAHRSTQRLLDALVSNAAQTGRGQGTDAGGALRIPDPKRGAEIQLVVSPFVAPPSADEWVAQYVSAIVILKGSEPESPIDPGLVASCFRLTPAEGRLVAALADGQDLDQIADQFQITRHTVRTNLRSAMGRAHRQAELVRLVLNSPVRIRR